MKQQPEGAPSVAELAERKAIAAEEPVTSRILRHQAEEPTESVETVEVATRRKKKTVD